MGNTKDDFDIDGDLNVDGAGVVDGAFSIEGALDVYDTFSMGLHATDYTTSYGWILNDGSGAPIIPAIRMYDWGSWSFKTTYLYGGHVYCM